MEPPNAYYETVSEELANIVKEVKESPRTEGYTTVAQVFEKSTRAATGKDLLLWICFISANKQLYNTLRKLITKIDFSVAV